MLCWSTTDVSATFARGQAARQDVEQLPELLVLLPELPDDLVLLVLVDHGVALDLLRLVGVAQRAEVLVVVVVRGRKRANHDRLRVSP